VETVNRGLEGNLIRARRGGVAGAWGPRRKKRRKNEKKKNAVGNQGKGLGLGLSTSPREKPERGGGTNTGRETARVGKTKGRHMGGSQSPPGKKDQMVLLV